MSVLKEIQSLPESKKKIILWTIVILLGLALLFFWSKNLEKKFKGLENEIDIPNLEIPNLNGNQETSTE